MPADYNPLEDLTRQGYEIPAGAGPEEMRRVLDVLGSLSKKEVDALVSLKNKALRLSDGKISIDVAGRAPF